METNDKNDHSDNKKTWKTPELIQLDVEETNAKPMMYISEFNTSYGAVS